MYVAHWNYKLAIKFDYYYSFNFSESDMRHYEEIEFKKGQARMAGQTVSNGEIVTSNTLPRAGKIDKIIHLMWFTN